MSRHDDAQIDPAGQAGMGAERRKPFSLEGAPVAKVTTAYLTGVEDERARILSVLTTLERDALPPLCVEGSPAARAVAGYVAKVRRVVEGGT